MKQITTIILMLCSISLFGSTKLDSVPYLTPQDSVFLTIDKANQKIIDHQLIEGQTMFSLAKFYGLELIELLYFNEALKNENEIPLGTIVKIPIPNRAIKRYKTKNFDESQHASIYYRVKKGETLYHIAKRLFKMPVEDVQARNGIPDFNIQPGQLLHLGWISTNGIPKKIRSGKILPPEWAESKWKARSYMQAKGVKRELGEQGVAFWYRNSKNTVDQYALHHAAPIGSVIEIHNPMNNRTVHVKVTGRPSSKVYYGENVVIVLSYKTARMLGARDPRFFVKVKYLK